MYSNTLQTPFDYGSKHYGPWSDCSKGRAGLIGHQKTKVDEQQMTFVMNGGKMVKKEFTNLDLCILYKRSFAVWF